MRQTCCRPNHKVLKKINEDQGMVPCFHGIRSWISFHQQTRKLVMVLTCKRLRDESISALILGAPPVVFRYSESRELIVSWTTNEVIRG